jgi:putative ABC transport system permease protein
MRIPAECAAMLSPRWRKMVGDAQASQGRLALLIGALAVSVAAFTTMLSAYSILRREVAANYLATNPASAQLVVDRVDESVARGARDRPGVADAEVSSTVRARVVTGGGDVRPALFFVVPSLNASRINKVRLTSGAWPASDNSIVLERSAVGVAEADVGQSLTVDLPNGQRRTLRVVGTVHDPSLAPAWQEQTVYGYVGPATLAAFGGDTDLHILKLVVSGPDAGANEIEVTARSVAVWLRSLGHAVQEIRVPPPRTHPHQAQMMTVLVMLLSFSVLGLVLGAVLGATIVGGLLAQQTRDIAVMKAVGARSGQIVVLYLAVIALVALLALAIGTVLGVMAGRAWVSATAQMLNLEIASYSFPAWALFSNLLIGVVVPLAAAAVPIYAACRRTVRDAIGDGGITRAAPGMSGLASAFASLASHGSATSLGLRNAFRRRGRLALVVLLIGASGGVFITSGNLSSAWNAGVAASAAARRYDLEIALQQPAPEEKVTQVLRSLAGVTAVESWPASLVNIDAGDHIDVSPSYPDGGHGRITLRAVPASSNMLAVDLIAGRWLDAADHDAIVVNSTARAVAFPHTGVGDTVDLLIRHQPRQLRVVGITREIMTAGTVYTTGDSFHSEDFPVGTTNTVRVALASRGAAEEAAATATAALEREGIPVRLVITEKLIRAAQTGHTRILVYALGFIALTMGIVGALALTSMLSSNVTERTREFGVLRAIGASGRHVRRVVLTEAMVGALLGAALAVPVSMPLSVVVGGIVTRISAQPLELRAAATPALVWFAVAVIGSIAAALYPALRATRLTVRETLAVR